MKRRIFLTALAAALLGGGAALAQETTDGVGRVTVDELKALMRSPKPPVVVDVRSGARRVIKGALNITNEEIESRLAELPRDREIITYCA